MKSSFSCTTTISCFYCVVLLPPLVSVSTYFLITPFPPHRASRRHSTSPSASLRIYLGRSISLSPSLSPSLRSLSITFSRPPPFHSGTGYYSRAVLSVSARPVPPFAS
ncbi:hypothetical protein CBS63078_5743 [Aspergillus niger]|nr:hypothetical protein CBS115989_9008 [Aspergillus niger]KAI2826633.1 hypothetical protein CBS133816_7252 [Aspergillus niger]KAI2840558.1 hypothetical protein CBS11350_6861 [Aspergillus niger]KAI2853708.1 hypothetical protein CBS11232_5443 [Aspergillus niger]KAI2875946.1 hypothetical protein CBS115988_4954 [Aspergillus niger]